MNQLIVGNNKTEIILDTLSGLRSFLLVDDGPIIDQFILRARRKYTELDFSMHSFNPLSRMNDLAAEEFIAILNALFPEGETTLTRKNSNHLIFKTLVESKPKTLERLFHLVLPQDPKDTDFKDAAQKIERLLLTSVLNDVLNKRRASFSPRGILLARINRAELGEFTSRALSWFLIGRYKGQVVLPDFGFYGRPFHASLIYQDRLIAGVHYLDETPLKRQLLLIENKIGRKCLLEDAQTLTDFAGHPKGSNKYNEEVERRMK